MSNFDEEKFNDVKICKYCNHNFEKIIMEEILLLQKKLINIS